MLASDLVEVSLLLRHHVEIADQVRDFCVLCGATTTSANRVVLVVVIGRDGDTLLPRLLTGALAQVRDLLRLREVLLFRGELFLIDQRPIVLRLPSRGILVGVLLLDLGHRALCLPMMA